MLTYGQRIQTGPLAVSYMARDAVLSWSPALPWTLPGNFASSIRTWRYRMMRRQAFKYYAGPVDSPHTCFNLVWTVARGLGRDSGPSISAGQGGLFCG